MEIEEIEIVGNTRTAERLIRRALRIGPGDHLRAGDPRLRASRFWVLALGYFADVQLSLRRGSAHGKVILSVLVVERGTLTLNRVHLGTSEATPVWAGLDLSDGNLLGSGIGIGAAFVWAASAEIEGADSQMAFMLRVFDQSLLGTRLGVHGWLGFRDASEPYRMSGDPGDGAPHHFGAFSYSRVGGGLGSSWALTRRDRVLAQGRLEEVDAGDFEHHSARGFVLRGASRVVTAQLGFDRDTRSDPVLPRSGERARMLFEYGDSWMGSDYRALKLGGHYQRWFGVGRDQVLSVRLAWGWLFGAPPGFDRFYIGDWNRLLPPRALDLVVSTRPTRDLLGASSAPPTYGDGALNLDVEYAYPLFRRRARAYGGDLFAAVGGLYLGEGPGRAVDVIFDLGVRLDTEIGVFELSLSNGLGRVPW